MNSPRAVAGPRRRPRLCDVGPCGTRPRLFRDYPSVGAAPSFRFRRRQQRWWWVALIATHLGGASASRWWSTNRGGAGA